LKEKGRDKLTLETAIPRRGSRKKNASDVREPKRLEDPGSPNHFENCRLWWGECVQQKIKKGQKGQGDINEKGEKTSASIKQPLKVV